MRKIKKSTIYTVMGISSLICTTVKELLVNNKRAKNIAYDMKSHDMIANF